MSNLMKNTAAEFVAAHNRLSLLTGGVIATCVFDHPTGWYYDPVGNEVFYVERVSVGPHGPIYKIDFGDEQMIGGLRDHGLHERLEE